MGNITNKQLNISSAGQIALNLDKQDENGSDGVITKSVWDTFWAKVDSDGRYKGRNEVTVGADGINVREAMKAIMTRIFNAAKALGEEVNKVGADWFNGMENAQYLDANKIDALKEESASEEASSKSTTEKTDNSQKADKPQKTEKAVETKKTGKKYSTSDIKVTVGQAYMSKKAKDIYNARKEGAALREDLKKGKTKNLTEANVAHALGRDTQFGPNTRKQAKIVFKLLVKRMKSLKIFQDGKDYEAWDSFSKLPDTNQNKLLHDYKRRIIDKENEILANAKKERDSINKVRAQMQADFDKANQVLVNIANNPKKAKITTKKDGSKIAELPNGQWIQVSYNDGELEISISHTISHEIDENGKTYDGAEVSYRKSYAEAGTNSNNSTKYAGRITSGYNFEKIKELAEAIFGKL